MTRMTACEHPKPRSLPPWGDENPRAGPSCGTPVECYAQAIKLLNSAEHKIAPLMIDAAKINSTVLRSAFTWVCLWVSHTPWPGLSHPLTHSHWSRCLIASRLKQKNLVLIQKMEVLPLRVFKLQNCRWNCPWCRSPFGQLIPI